jgi:hypothetical protein
VYLERYRKEAKALLKAFRAGAAEASARAEAVLGDRARERFRLADAQHVVAVEHGYPTWPALKHAAETAAPERPVGRIGLQPVSFYEERAKALAAGIAARDEESLARARAYVPRGADDPYVVVAREYGFETWRALVASVERVRSENEGQREGSPEVVAALAAIRDGDVERLRLLLDEHPALAGRPHRGAWQSLLEAVAQPDAVGEGLGVELGVEAGIVRLLIERSDDLDGPLNLAACFNRGELVRMLLAAGADPAPDPARGLTPLETALYHGARESAEQLAERDISPLALWSAAALGRVDLLARLQTTPAAVAHRPNLADVGWPPAPPAAGDEQTILDEALCFAALNGRDVAIEWLLDRGASPSGSPYLGVTPLHFAVQFSRPSTVQLLLSAGADPTRRDQIHGGTPAGWARYLGRTMLAGLIDGIDTGRSYLPGEPVRLRVEFRRFPYVGDAGRAVALAGRPPGWQAVAENITRDRTVNISRNGVLSLPVVRDGPGFDAIVERIADASVELYEELLELSD